MNSPEKMLSIKAEGGAAVTATALLTANANWDSKHGYGRSYRAAIWSPSRNRIQRNARQKRLLAFPLRLRAAGHLCGYERQERRIKILRVSTPRTEACNAYSAWSFGWQRSGVSHLACDAISVSGAWSGELQILRRARDICLRRMVRLSEFSRVGDFQRISQRSFHRPHRCERRLHAAELPLGYPEGAGEQQAPALGQPTSERLMQRVAI